MDVDVHLPVKRYLSREEAAAWLGVSVDNFMGFGVSCCDFGTRSRRWDIVDIVAYAEDKKSCDSAREKPGIEDFRFHNLRHTFASRLVHGGVPIYNVMHLTGHRSLTMVQRYAHLAPDYQEGAIRVLDSRTDTQWHNLGTADGAGNPEDGVKSLKRVVPPVGLEPTTPALRIIGPNIP